MFLINLILFGFLVFYWFFEDFNVMEIWDVVLKVEEIGFEDFWVMNNMVDCKVMCFDFFMEFSFLVGFIIKIWFGVFVLILLYYYFVYVVY